MIHTQNPAAIARGVLLASAGVFGALGSASALAQDVFPSKTVTLVVPAAAGGGFDMFARLISPTLSEKWGQSVLVDNRPGGATNIGATHVANAEPDGHTLLIWNDTMLINPALMSDVPFDPQKDFTPVSLAMYLPNVLMAHPSTGFTRFEDMIEYAKANPDQLSYASAGNGSTGHLGTELMKNLTDTEITHIPYKGAGPALVDAIGGHVPLVIVAVPGAMEYIKNQQLVPLAVSSTERVAALPDVPTFQELGLDDYNMSMFMGVLGPAGMDPAVVERIDQDFRDTVMNDPIHARLVELGFQPVGLSAAEFAAMVERDLPVWRELAESTGSKMD